MDRAAGFLASTAVGMAVAAACGARVGGPEGRGPGVTFPASFAEGSRQDGGGATAPAAASATTAERDATPGPPRTGYAPDPEPLRVAHQWEYEVVHENGVVRVASVTRRTFAKPIVTSRRVGRYAIELWIGQELVERVRFDFPLSAAETPRRSRREPLHEPPSFAEGVTATVSVLVPAGSRATRAILLDRATGRSRPLPWPPDDPIAPPVRGTNGRAKRPRSPSTVAEPAPDVPP